MAMLKNIAAWQLLIFRTDAFQKSNECLWDSPDLKRRLAKRIQEA
jgi:hypothetical protein